MTTAQRAFELAQRGFATFPVREDKTPYAVDGLKSASLDPWAVQETFEKYPKALIAVHTGMSGVTVLDIDLKLNDDGEAVVDGFERLDENYYTVPKTEDYDSLSGLGKHYMYLAPEGKNLAPKAAYRGMKGVDRRSGESYVVYTGEGIPDRDKMVLAPEWLCDETTVRSSAAFEGTLKDWFETLEPGAPNALVRKAMERAQEQFDAQDQDFSHSDIVSATFEAVRLGSERNSGVPELLALLEDLFYARTGEHSRPESEWGREFQEALQGGIEKYGDAIELFKSLPAYSPGIVPTSVPDRLVFGEPGDKEVFRDLLRELQNATDDDLLVTSILWNAPRTKDLARYWGLTFVHEDRVLKARTKPEPIRENPSLPAVEPEKDTSVASNNPVSGTFLSADEMEKIAGVRTFIDSYMDGTGTKGFTNRIYAVPAAWTCLSMAFGRKAFIPLSKPLEVNLWYIVLGASTTGKGTEDRFLRGVLNAMFLDGESENYNLGALSSPDGLHLGLINRDNKPSIIHNDEAADFFQDIKTKDWMATVPDRVSKWFDGFVEPSSKISLKEARGKSAHTSLNQLMWGTPDRLLALLDATQFESGYLARVNWVWDRTIPDPNRKSDLHIQEGRTSETPDAVYALAADLLHAGAVLGDDRVAVGGTEEAQARLNKAADDFRARGRKSPRWSFMQRAVDRLVMETIWKCAALTALYRGEREFTVEDALVAIRYAGEWLETLLEVSESISESPYSRDVEQIESFIREEGGTVTRAGLLHRFRGTIIRSRRELDDRIEFAIDSGRINRYPGKDGQDMSYRING